MTTKKQVSQDDLNALADLAREGLAKLEACSRMADELMEVEDKNHDWAADPDNGELAGTLGVLLDYQCCFEETLHVLAGLRAYSPAEVNSREPIAQV